jgi:prepilin-type processing-associated H-X9-DG protein
MTDRLMGLARYLGAPVAVTALVAIGAPGALAAAKPIRGGLYETTGRPSAMDISFLVSANGRELIGLTISGGAIREKCPVVGKFAFPMQAKVTGDHFKVAAYGIIPPPNGIGLTPVLSLGKYDSASVSGTFQADGSVNGAFLAREGCKKNRHVRGSPEVIERFGHRFASTARPAGANSLFCDGHNAAYNWRVSRIIAVAVRCAKVYAALEDGMFGAFEEHGLLPFSTPGWRCTTVGGYGCSRPPARFTFNAEPPPESQPATSA